MFCGPLARVMGVIWQIAMLDGVFYLSFTGFIENAVFWLLSFSVVGYCLVWLIICLRVRVCEDQWGGCGV